MKVLPHGAIVYGSKGSPSAFSSMLEKVKKHDFTGYLEVRMRIPGAELWGVVVFDNGKLVESYANKMGTDVFGEAAYVYLFDLSEQESTVVSLHELDEDNILDFLMLGRGRKIKMEDDSWRPDPDTLELADDRAPPIGDAPAPPDIPEGESVVKKVVLLGDPSVGKTSIMRRFVENTFDEAYLSTIGSNVNKKTVTLYDDSGGSTSVRLMIWDIAGDRACDSLKTAYYRGAHAGIVVFDITMHNTLESVPEWIESLHRTVGEIPVLILGNKADLEEFKRVDQEEVIDLGERLGVRSLLTSARTGENVQMAFHLLAEKMVAH